MTEEKIVMFDTPGIAIPETLEVWKALDGRHYLTKELAVQASYTHENCLSCGKAVVERGRRCSECNHKFDMARWVARTQKSAGEDTMLYSDTLEAFFNGVSELCDAVSELEGTPDVRELRIRHCRPVYPDPLDEDTYLCDMLAEDSEVPGELMELIADFNEKVKALNLILSWEPGDERLSDESIAELNKRIAEEEV